MLGKARRGVLTTSSGRFQGLPGRAPPRRIGGMYRAGKPSHHQHGVRTLPSLRRYTQLMIKERVGWTVASLALAALGAGLGATGVTVRFGGPELPAGTRMDYHGSLLSDGRLKIYRVRYHPD